MRPIFLHLLAPVLLLGSFSRLQADDAAVAVIDEAIKAHGGLDNLTKTHLMSRSAQGSVVFFGQEVPFTDELVVQLPRRSRWTFEGGPEGQKSRLILAYNGEKAWQSAAGTVRELTRDRLEEWREEIYVLWVASLSPLKTEKGFSFIALADEKVNDKPAQCVLVSQKGHNDLKLYFDKASNLLVKIERKAREGGVQANKEYLYSEHKIIDGVKLPTKYMEMKNGTKLVDVSTLSYKFLSRVDDSTFAKP